MKKNLIKLFALSAMALVGWSCETDYYNENYLDGYESDDKITDVQQIEYTLAEGDYTTIARNATNQATAEAAGEEAKQALAAIGTNKYFANEDEAGMYIPAFIAASYPTLDDTSVAMVTYRSALEVPAEIGKMNAAKEYTLKKEDYQAIWGSETEFEQALTPATIGKLPEALAAAYATEEIAAGDYVVVTYNYSAEEPKAEEPEEPSTPSDPDEPVQPDEPTTNYTSILGTAVSGDAVEVKGWISAVSTMGPILTDNGGSVLLYDKNNAAFPALKVGDEVTVSGTMGDYKTGLQIAASGASVEVTGTKSVAYPTPTELTGEVMNTMKDRTENEPSLFIKATGTMKVSVSGDYTNYNLVVEGADGCQISFYGPTSEVIGQIVDGQTATLYGYLTGITGSSTKYFSTVAVKIETATASANVATALQSSKQYGFYQWDGAKFAAADVAIVQPEDFTEMGQNYGNFSNPAQDDYLPKFLAKNYPYGMEGDKVNVLYRCYAGGANSWRVDEYISNGSAWIKTIYFADMVGQFRKAEGVWKVDRTLELAYTEMGSADFKAFCQYCCNWVYDFVDVPLGAPARDNAGVILSADKVTVGGNSPSGAWWVSSYGNNEWYAGTYAYYGEMNWSGSKARAAWENLGYTGLSDDELIAKMQQNAAIVFQNVLGYMYPEMTPEEYNQVVIKVYDYISKANWAYTFKTVGTGTFEYVEGSLTKL